MWKVIAARAALVAAIAWLIFTCYKFVKNLNEERKAQKKAPLETWQNALAVFGAISITVIAFFSIGMLFFFHAEPEKIHTDGWFVLIGVFGMVLYAVFIAYLFIPPEYFSKD